MGGFWQLLYSNSTKGISGHLWAVFGASYIQTPLRGFWVIYGWFLAFLIFKLHYGDFGSFLGVFWHFLYSNSTNGILGHFWAVFVGSYGQTLPGDFGSFMSGFWQFLYPNSTKGNLCHLWAVFVCSCIQT